MAKRVSARRIKKDRLYTYQMAAELLGVSVQTVRSWRLLGLNVLTEKKPHYILGEALIEFLGKRQEKRSAKMHADQFYCFTCRSPQRPYGMMADYVPTNDVRGRLEALCEACEGRCHRFVNEAFLKELGEIFEIARRSARQA